MKRLMPVLLIALFSCATVSAALASTPGEPPPAVSPPVVDTFKAARTTENEKAAEAALQQSNAAATAAANRSNLASTAAATRKAGLVQSRANAATIRQKWNLLRANETACVKAAGVKRDQIALCRQTFKLESQQLNMYGNGMSSPTGIPTTGGVPTINRPHTSTGSRLFKR